jgi:hypothetical protein
MRSLSSVVAASFVTLFATSPVKDLRRAGQFSVKSRKALPGLAKTLAIVAKRFPTVFQRYGKLAYRKPASAPASAAVLRGGPGMVELVGVCCG